MTVAAGSGGQTTTWHALEADAALRQQAEAEKLLKISAGEEPEAAAAAVPVAAA